MEGFRLEKVMGHVGLTPQSSGALGGFRARGRTAESARAIIEDARAAWSFCWPTVRISGITVMPQGANTFPIFEK